MFGKNVGSHVFVLGCNCVAAIEADDFRCGSFGCRAFYLCAFKCECFWLEKQFDVSELRNVFDNSMSRFWHDVCLRIAKGLNVGLLSCPVVVCWCFFYEEQLNWPLGTLGNLAVILVFVFLYFVFGRTYDAFLISINRLSEMIFSQFISAFLSNACLYVVICLVFRQFVPVLPIVLVLLIQVLLSTFWCWLSQKWYYLVFPQKKCAMVYDNNLYLNDLLNQYDMKNKYDVKKLVNVDECIANLSTLDDIEIVFLNDIHSHERNIIMMYCLNKGIDVFMIPRIGDVIMSGAKRVHMLHLPILRVGYYHPTPEYYLFKRFFDLLVSGVAIFILSPVMMITAIVIKVYDGGPILYKQKRITKDGKVFNVLKFRSMKVDAEKDGVARLSTGNSDSRITPVGRIIRKCRIDELPQLFNILAGTMSIVGPRPERPEIAKEYEKDLPEFRLRLQVKAGLTGYAQVYGKYNTSPYNKLLLDLMYIAHPSLVVDLRICFATIKILFIGESTEGIAEGKTTAER